MKMTRIILLLTIFFKTINCSSQISVNSSNQVLVGNGTTQSLFNVFGDTYIPGGSSYYLNTSSNVGIRLRLHNNGSSSYIDTYPSLSFRCFQSTFPMYTPLFLSSSAVGIFNVSPSYALDVNGTIRCTGFTNTSDGRLKKNIHKMTGTLTSLNKLNGVTYQFKSDSVNIITAAMKNNALYKSDTLNSNQMQLNQDTTYLKRSHIGFIAQDLQKIYPELVYADKKGILSIDYISLIPVLVEAIKEQQILIENLKTSLDVVIKKIKIQ